MKDNRSWTIIKEIDLFGKEPNIYYKGKQRKTTWMGRICTWVYVCIYIFFFIYKLVRMFKRQDVSFSETNSSTGGLPKIHLTKEIFTYGIALSDYNQNPFIDETIYKPSAMLYGKKTINGIEVPVFKTIEFGICTIDDFGENYKQYASKYNLSNFYCFKNFDIELEGYSSAENNTYIIISINKCMNFAPNGQPCQDPSIIEDRLNNHFLLIFSEDFDITPYDFEHPVKAKLNVNSCPLSIEQLQTFVGYYQLTNIETDYNLFGFEALADIKREKYLIYHSALIMATTMDKTKPEVIRYNIMMTEKILTNQRTYTQLIDVLGDVGGLMEVIQSIFGIICVFVADILYDKTMVNNLFSFDLEDYKIKFKTKFNKSNLNSLGDDLDKQNLDYSKKTLSINENKEIIKPKLNKFNIIKNSYYQNNCNLNISSSERASYFKRNYFKAQKSIKLPQSKTININNGSNINEHEVKVFEIEKVSDESKTPQKIFIKKLDMNIFCTYFCFCYSRKRENFANALLDEAMNIITEKLEIYNIFRNMYYVDDIKKKNNYIYEDREISEECKQKLKDISHKIYNSLYRL